MVGVVVGVVVCVVVCVIVWSEETKQGMGEVMESYIASSNVDGAGLLT